jgi:hypothetical protein
MIELRQQALEPARVSGGLYSTRSGFRNSR